MIRQQTIGHKHERYEGEKDTKHHSTWEFDTFVFDDTWIVIFSIQNDIFNVYLVFKFVFENIQ